jgi:hypothetical protein
VITQLDDVQQFANDNFPLRAILRKSTDADVAYDGDPNDVAAPAILDNAPVGTKYFRASINTTYRRLSNAWIETSKPVTSADPFELFVDPAGDDSNNGLTPGTAFETIARATESIPLYGDGTVNLSAGHHKLKNGNGLGPGGGNATLNIVQAFRNVDILGTLSVSQTVNVLSIFENVLTVSDTLVVNALRGKAVQWTQGVLRERWIISNTVNTITVAAHVSAFGGNQNIPTGSIDVVQLDTRVTPPDTNSNAFYNRLQFDGNPVFKHIDFDGNNGTGGFGGPTVLDKGSAGNFVVCKIRNWTQGLNGADTQVTTCWWETNSSHAFQCSFTGFVISDNVFRDCGSGINVADDGFCILGANAMSWIDGVDAFIRGRATAITDFHEGFYLTNDISGSTNYAHLTGVGMAYKKSNSPILKVGGNDDFTNIIFLDGVGGVTVDMLDSANAVIGASVYILDDAVSISLANYNAGSAPATGVQRYSNDKGTFVFK